MNATTLLDALLGAGIRLGRDGEDLLADVLPGADLDVHTEHIQASKPALLAELHQRDEIVAAASADPEHFDRETYNRLWARWNALDTKVESVS